MYCGLDIESILSTNCLLFNGDPLVIGCSSGDKTTTLFLPIKSFLLSMFLPFSLIFFWFVFSICAATTSFLWFFKKTPLTIAIFFPCCINWFCYFSLVDGRYWVHLWIWIVIFLHSSRTNRCARSIHPLNSNISWAINVVYNHKYL